MLTVTCDHKWRWDSDMVWTKDADTDRYGVEMPPPLALLGQVTGGEERGEDDSTRQ